MTGPFKRRLFASKHHLALPCGQTVKQCGSLHKGEQGYRVGVPWLCHWSRRSLCWFASPAPPPMEGTIILTKKYRKYKEKFS